MPKRINFEIGIWVFAADDTNSNYDGVTIIENLNLPEYINSEYFNTDTSNKSSYYCFGLSYNLIKNINGLEKINYILRSMFEKTFLDYKKDTLWLRASSIYGRSLGAMSFNSKLILGKEIRFIDYTIFTNYEGNNSKNPLKEQLLLIII